MMAPKRLWESRAASWETGRAHGGNQSESDSDDMHCSPLQAGERLVEMLLDLQFAGKLSAKQLCVICHWASLAGCEGPAKTFAYSPAAQTGKYQRHLDRVTNAHDFFESLYMIRVPGYNKFDASRAVHELPVRPPHEAVAEEIGADRSILDKLSDIPRYDWGENYRHHPVAKDASFEAVPLALYVDGVPFTKKGSMIVFQVVNLLSDSRHLACVLRKSHMCACGCHGWCTLHCVFTYLKWSFQALADGKHPGTQWDGTRWDETVDRDIARCHFAGRPLGLRGALVMIRGDWSEYAISFGFPTWASKHFPCPWCTTDKEGMMTTVGVTPFAMPCPRTTEHDYDQACSRAEVWVSLSRSEHSKLVPLLKYDKKPQGPRGRALQSDVPELGLRKNDRLEPHSGLLDIAAFDRIHEFPARVLFWRRSSETRTRHRNVLLDKGLGVSVQSLAVDSLHALNLGVFMVFVSKALWTCLQNNVYRLPTGSTSEKERLLVGVMRMRTDLWNFYKLYKSKHPDQDVCEVEDLTLGMLGSPDDGHVAAKAAETKYLVLFATWLLKAYQNNIPDPKPLIELGETFARLIEIMHSEPPRFKPGIVQESYLSQGDFNEVLRRRCSSARPLCKKTRGTNHAQHAEHTSASHLDTSLCISLESRLNARSSVHVASPAHSAREPATSIRSETVCSGMGC